LLNFNISNDCNFAVVKYETRSENFDFSKNATQTNRHLQMTKILAIGATEPSGILQTLEIERRKVDSNDVEIMVKYCGMCHSDLHHAKGEWGVASRPAVPGHEIVGQVKSVGDNVQKFKKGDLVGVGCFVDSCRKCPECTRQLVQYCSGPRYKGTGPVNTYGHPDQQEGHTKGIYN
jgi:alcohol dehydrogenase (NADP+)